MTNGFNFNRKNRGNRDRKKKKNDTWIISMWSFNQYRVLKIKVIRNIYHKAPDVQEQVSVRALQRPPRNHWNSCSVYHHD